MYTIILTDTFECWFMGLTVTERKKVYASIELLREYGHELARPHADHIKDSNLSNLKELRTQVSGKPYRSFFVFDPLRQAVLLCGGDKTGDKQFYKRMIPIAENLYSEYLEQLDITNKNT